MSTQSAATPRRPSLPASTPLDDHEMFVLMGLLAAIGGAVRSHGSTRRRTRKARSRTAGHRRGRHRRNIVRGRHRHDRRGDARRRAHAVAPVGHGPARRRYAAAGHRRWRRSRGRGLARHRLSAPGAVESAHGRRTHPSRRDVRHFDVVRRRSRGRPGHRSTSTPARSWPLGGNGAGKSTLIKILSGASRRLGPDLHSRPAGVDSEPAQREGLGIETIYQTLALADNVDAAANFFLGRELDPLGRSTTAMEAATRKVMGRLNPHFQSFKTPVKSLSGGQRQSVRSRGRSTSMPVS